MKLGVVILAAGESSRMGRAKQTLPWRDTTLLQHAIRTARVLEEAAIIVVLGARAAEVRPELPEPRVTFIENPDWSAGLGSSLRCGLGALLENDPHIDAAIIMLCDQPLLSSETLPRLTAEYVRTQRPIVAAEYAGVLGVPALFARSLFPELLGLQGATGARQIIQMHRTDAIGVPLPEAAVDIDTPADYAHLRALEATQHPSPASISATADQNSTTT